MFKIILCLILICACGTAGILKAQQYSQRVRELNEFKDMCLNLKTEISYMKDPLPVIFERIADSRENIASEMLKTCCQLMKDNQDMQYSWYSAVDMAARTGAVTRDDKAVIYDLGTQLGRSNVQGQLDLLEMTEQKLDIKIREAEALKKTKGKMYAGLGFSIGTVIAILLL